MNRIFLIRHAQPRFPTPERYCIGQTDLPLSTLGKLQAVLLSGWLTPEIRQLPVFTSPLSRASETAAFLSRNTQIEPDLMEMYAGDWDGLRFQEISRRWPDIFQKRGIDQNIPIPGAEDAQHGLNRFLRGLERCRQKSSGDFVAVAHSTVIQAFLSHVLHTPLSQSRAYKLPLASVTLAEYDKVGRILYYGKTETPPLHDALCQSLLYAAGGSKTLIAHCCAVSNKAEEIARALQSAGYSIDVETVHYAALLHDIARAEQNHPQIAASWMEELGYPQLSDAIRFHHDHDGLRIDEAAVVFIADKCVQGSLPVSVHARFAASRLKCLDVEAQAVHRQRYTAAKMIMEKINLICRGDLIQ